MTRTAPAVVGAVGRGRCPLTHQRLWIGKWCGCIGHGSGIMGQGPSMDAAVPGWLEQQKANKKRRRRRKKKKKKKKKSSWTVKKQMSAAQSPTHCNIASRTTSVCARQY